MRYALKTITRKGRGNKYIYIHIYILKLSLHCLFHHEHNSGEVLKVFGSLSHTLGFMAHIPQAVIVVNRAVSLRYVKTV